MTIACLDVEGVWVSVLRIVFGEKTGVSECGRTKCDESEGFLES